MEAGPMRFRLKFQAPDRGESARSGEVVIDWQDVATVWGNVRPLTSRESVQFAQTGKQASHEVTVRYRPGVAEDQRILFGTRVLDIVGVRNLDERKRELRIMVNEFT